MATGTVVNFWKDANNAYLAVNVNEGGAVGNVEYIGAVDLPTFQALPDAASKKAALVQAVKTVRDAQVTAAPVAQSGVSGTVTL